MPEAAGVRTTLEQRALRGKRAYLSGVAAEEQVKQHYLSRGHALLEQRWRGRAGGGEIDLIFADGDGFIFVEVKKSSSFARAASRLTHAQCLRLFSGAEAYLAHLGRNLLTDMRFDAALLDQHGNVKVLENALGHF